MGQRTAWGDKRMSTPENIRYYASGFLGAAITLVKDGKPKAASVLLAEVGKYMEQSNVDCPQPMRDLVAKCTQDPTGHLTDIIAIEVLFTNPANTALEEAGIRFGSG